MKTFIVNLDKDRERWTSVEAQVKREGLDYERMPAVLGKALSDAQLAVHYSARKASWRQARALTPAEIGCALSHLRVYREIELRGLSHALILEDDVVLPSGMAELLQDLMQYMDEDEPAIILLSDAETDETRPSVSVAGGRALKGFHKGFFTSSYCVNRAAASYLLAELHPVGDVADCWSRLKHSGNLQIMAVTPSVIEQNQLEFGSTTTQDIQAVLGKSSLSRWVYRLRRVRNILFARFVEANRRPASEDKQPSSHHPVDSLGEG